MRPRRPRSLSPLKPRLASSPPPAPLPRGACALAIASHPVCPEAAVREERRGLDDPRAGLGGQWWRGRDWAIGAQQMSQVLMMVLLVPWALVHQAKWLELMCFAQLTRNILTLWAS